MQRTTQTGRKHALTFAPSGSPACDDEGTEMAETKRTKEIQLGETAPNSQRTANSWKDSWKDECGEDGRPSPGPEGHAGGGGAGRGASHWSREAQAKEPRSRGAVLAPRRSAPGTLGRRGGHDPPGTEQPPRASDGDVRKTCDVNDRDRNRSRKSKRG